MADRLLNRKDIALMLATSGGVAIAQLEKFGCHPIDFGRGAHRGLRWLESDVIRAMRLMHMEAQPKERPIKNRKPKAAKDALDLANMSGKEVYEMLTHATAIQ